MVTLNKWQFGWIVALGIVCLFQYLWIVEETDTRGLEVEERRRMFVRGSKQIRIDVCGNIQLVNLDPTYSIRYTCEPNPDADWMIECFGDQCGEVDVRESLIDGFCAMDWGVAGKGKRVGCAGYRRVESSMEPPNPPTIPPTFILNDTIPSAELVRPLIESSMDIQLSSNGLPPLSDNDVVVLVMSARNDVERRKAIRESWARGHTDVFFMVGDKACAIPPSYRTTAWSCEAKGPVPFDVQTPYDTKVAGEDALLKDEAEAHSDLILLPMVDYYRALPRKLKEMYRWALDHTEAKWMVKVDDDAVARIPELETMLAKQDANKLVVMGNIQRGSGVPRSGKWAEPDFIGPKYPSFANGAQGHAVTRGVAKAVVAHDGFEYQGEDVSLGIWMDEMKKPVQWVHSPQHFVAHGNCNDKSSIVIGHNIPPAKMRACFPTLGSLHHTLIGRLGNQLFQYASTVGIADVHGMTACIRGGDLATYFDGVDTGCTVVSPKKHVSDNKYATHNAFEFDGDTVLDGYLQSFKYFAPNVRDTIRFKQPILNEASNYLEQYKSRTTVGIHVRRGDHVHSGYMVLPPENYFLNVLSYFRTKYSNAQFVVASDDPTWCSKQSFFVADDVRVVTETHEPAIDMAILVGCDHMVMTVGTFGWWAAYLGADAKGGEVVYYDSQFKMVHPTNKGNVVLEDYYPEGWVAMGGTKPLSARLEWERHLPSTQVKNDWCPSKGSDGAVFVQSLYTDKASEHATTCTQIQRVGGSGDGGKLICADDVRPNDCVVYSLGSRLDFSFEIDVIKRFGCQVHTFDCTVGTPPASKIPAGVSFHPWCVGGKDEAKSISSDLGHQGELGQYYTLTTIREKLGHTSIDLLKMDIERHEFAVVATLKDDNAPHQIAFETHLHNAYGMWGRPVSEDEWATMWATLGGLGYRVFAHESNPFCVCCCEFSLVRGTPTVEHDVNRRLFRIHGTRAGFRAVLRISGSTLQTSLFERAERGVVVAPYHTCTTGTYEATVKVLFDGETEWSPTSCYVRNHSLDKMRAIVWEVNDTSSCERDGWWDNNHRIPFQTRRVVDVPKEYPKLRWVEKHHAVTEIPPNVCFAGDSQMRNNLNGITTCGGVQAQRTKTACAPHRYFQVRWASDVQDVDFSGCERIVLNFGQWYLGWPGGSMTTVQEFETILTKLLGSFEQRSKLIWMTTNPMPSIYENGHEDVCPPKDWRQPYAIQDYVHVEKRLMLRFNVPVWDTFSRLFDAYDLGFDQYHYTTPLTDAIIAPLQLLLVRRVSAPNTEVAITEERLRDWRQTHAAPRTAHVLSVDRSSPRAQHTRSVLETLGFEVRFVDPERVGYDKLSKVRSNKKTFLRTLQQHLDNDGPEWLYVFEDDIGVDEAITMERIGHAEDQARLFFYLGICRFPNDQTETKTACGRCAHAMAFSREGARQLIEFSRRSYPNEPYFDVVVEQWCIANGKFLVLDPKARHPDPYMGLSAGFYQARRQFPSEIDNAHTTSEGVALADALDPDVASTPMNMYLSGLGTAPSMRAFVGFLFPEMEQRVFTSKSAATERDLLFVQWGLNVKFPGKTLYLNGEPSYANQNLAPRSYYLGPVARGNTDDARTMQLYYATFAIVHAGLHRLTAPRRRQHDGTHFLLYRSRNCKEHRQNAFRRICAVTEHLAGTPCHYTGCTAGPAIKYKYNDHGKSWGINHQETPFRFELSMDNTKLDGYVSEKILNAFLSGSIPIYYGTTDVFKLFNKDAFIYYDIDDPQPALDRILYLETNRTAYAEVLAQPILADGALEEYFSLSDDVGGGRLKQRIRDMVFGHPIKKEVEPTRKTNEIPRPTPTQPTYHSSLWEQQWLDNIETWQNGKICDMIAKQQPQLRAFMNATCSALTDTAWCLLDDSVHQLWYNTKTGTLSKTKPRTIRHVDAVSAVHPTDANIFSRFEWPDGRVEFIEPLVSHLRHPMMHCGDGNALFVDRSYVIPPPNLIAAKSYYFDAGASSWSSGAGGPSLSYFTTVWERHGIEFDQIEGWEGSTTPANFYKTVPPKYRDRTHYHQQWIASSPDQTAPFVPTVIRRTADKEDYVLFKLDIDNGAVEKGTVDHLLSDDNDDLDWIDEFVWEHHVKNYIMQPMGWGNSIDTSMSIADSYQYFLRLRQKGVRAHSWV